MYADRVTKSMERAIGETNRRRGLQVIHNLEHGITPTGVARSVSDILETYAGAAVANGGGSGARRGGGLAGRGERPGSRPAPLDAKALTQQIQHLLDAFFQAQRLRVDHQIGI